MDSSHSRSLGLFGVRLVVLQVYVECDQIRLIPKQTNLQIDKSHSEYIQGTRLAAFANHPPNRPIERLIALQIDPENKNENEIKHCDSRLKNITLQVQQAMCVLQCAAVCCSMLQCVAVCCRHSCLPRCVISCMCVLQCVIVCCSVLQCVADILVDYGTYYHAFVNCNVLQCAAVCCSVLQYVALQY